MSLREELIAVYAKTPLADMGNSPEYLDLRDRYREDAAFPAECIEIEPAKAMIEENLKPPLTHAQEAREALALLAGLRRNRDERRRLVVHQLIVAGYRDKWSPAQRQYFDDASKKIARKNDFFLSFTARYADQGAVNPVNLDYRWFIVRILGQEEFDDSRNRKRNLLAMAVNRILKRSLLQGFFYPDSEFDNRKVIPKLDAELEDSLVFVQLVQNVMFEIPEEGENHCFNEFRKAAELLTGDPGEEKRMLFVVAENSRASLQKLGNHVPSDYKHWHSKILEKGIAYLGEVDEEDYARIREVKKMLTENLVPPVLAALDEIAENVPE